MVYLAYTGMQDMFLTEEPTFTHFKTMYTRDIPSTSEVVEQPFDKTKNRVGDTLIATLKQSGDYITGVSLKFVLPGIQTQTSQYWTYPNSSSLTGKSMRVFDPNGTQLYQIQLNGLTTTTQNLNWFNVSGLNSFSRVISSSGYGHTMYVTLGGFLYGWGFNTNGQLGIGADYTDKLSPVLVVSTGGVSAVSSGDFHTLFFMTDGTLYAMGLNSSGQLGLGDNDDRNIPTRVTLPVGEVVSSIACAGEQSFIITKSGNLYGMGLNNFGQLGLGDFTNRNTPTFIASGVGYAASGYFSAFYITTTGNLYAFGRNDEGQLGLGDFTDRDTPTFVTSGVKQVSSGDFFSGYLSDSGELFMTGNNNYGQFGNGTTTPYDSFTSVGTDVKSFDCGGYHTVYTTSNGTLYGMGLNDQGQLGIGTFDSPKTTPVQIFLNVGSESGGIFHTHFINTNGQLYGMGGNADGQVGDGTDIDKDTPVNIQINNYIENPVKIQNNKFNFSVSSPSCYAVFDDINVAHFWGFVYNPIQLFGGFVRFDNVNSNQVTFQECGWIQKFNVTYSYLDDTLYKFINSVGLYIGKQLIQEFDSAYIKSYKETSTTYKNRPVLKLLEGNDNVIESDRTYYFEIPFIDVPFYAIPRHDIQIRLKTNPLNQFDFYVSAVVNYDTFVTRNLPLEYTLFVPQVSYFTPGTEKLDIRGCMKKLIITGQTSNSYSLSLNGEFFTDYELSRTSAFENLINLPVESNVIVFNNPINMSRIRDQKFTTTQTSNVGVYAETLNVLKISNQMSGLLFGTTETGGYPIVTGNIINQTPTGATYLFDQISSSVPNILSFYSMRLVNPSYSGPVIRLRNTTTDQEADFYTDDTQSYLRTLDGSISADDWTSPKVVRWYDQYFNLNDMYQDDQYYQPTLYKEAGGTYVIRITNSGASFIPPQQFLKITNPLYIQQIVMQFTSDGNAFTPIFSNGSDYKFVLYYGDIRGLNNSGDWVYFPGAGTVYWKLDDDPNAIYVNPDQWTVFTSYATSLPFYDSTMGGPMTDFTRRNNYFTSDQTFSGKLFEMGFFTGNSLSGGDDSTYYSNRKIIS